jgi:acyl carrier protein
MSVVEETVLKLVRETCVDASPTLSRNTPVAEAGITSLDLMDIIFTVEERFGIEVPYHPNVDEHRMESVGQLIDMIEELVAARGGVESAAAESEANVG